MPKRYISSDLWNDAAIERLTFHARYLFIYLITSPHTSQAGIGQATDRKISSETGIEQEGLAQIFEELKELVVRHQEWFWVKNFLKHQGQNKNFCIAALKYAEKTPFFDEFNQNCANIISQYKIKQIRSEQGVSKPYANGIDTVSEQCRNGIDMVSERYRYGIDTLSEKFAEPLEPISSQAASVTGVNESQKVILCWSEKLSIIQFSELEKMAIQELDRLGCTPDDAFQARLENPKYFGRLDGEHTKRLIITQKDIRLAKKASGHGLPCAF